jgi:hypothetical protein
MPVSDELIAELDKAVAQIDEPTQVPEETPEVPKETPEPEVPAETNEVPVVDSTDEVPEEDEKPEVPVVPVVNTISDYAIERAVRAGVSYSDAKAFTSEDQLVRITASMEALKIKEPENKEEESEEEDILAGLTPLDPDEFEPSAIKMYENLVDVIRKREEKHQKEIKELRANQTQLVDRSKEAVLYDTEKWFDEQIDGLGDDYVDTLGKGSYSSLAPGSPQLNTRDDIANKIAVLIAGARATGSKPPSRDEAFEMAAQLVLKDKVIAAHEKRLAGDLAKRSTQHLNRAGGKTVKIQKTPQQEAAEMLNAKFGI